MGRAEQLAWAAGLYEGEGSIYLDRSDQRRRDGRVRIGMSLSTTDQDVAMCFWDYVRVGAVFGPYTAAKGTKPYWTWHLRNATQVKALATELAPLLSIRRRKQIAEALSEKATADVNYQPKPLGPRRLPRIAAGQERLTW